MSQSTLNPEDTDMDANDLKRTEDNLVNRITAFFAEKFKPAADTGVVKLEERLGALEVSLAEKTTAVTTLEARLAESTTKLAEAEKKLSDQAESVALAEFNGRIDKLVAAGKITPAERDLQVQLAASHTPEQRNQVIALIDARAGTPIFRELTPAEKQGTEKPAAGNARTAAIRQRAEARLSEAPGDESATETLAVCQLMESAGNESMTFAQALTAHRSKK